MNRFLSEVTTNSLIVAVLLFLVACGGAKKDLVNQADVNLAQNAGTLPKLYDKTLAQLEESSGKEKETLRTIKNQISELLVNEKLALVNKGIGKTTSYGILDLESIDELITLSASIKVWNEQEYSTISSKLGLLKDKTLQEISLSNEFANEYQKDIVKRFEYMKKSAVLSGKNSEAMNSYNQELKKAIDQLSTQGRDAYKKRMFNMALDISNMGLAIDPGNLQFESLLEQSTTSLFEQDFRDALENGKPEIAYQALLDIADKPVISQIKKNMRSSIILLSNYFANNAKVSFEKNDWKTAYEAFIKGRSIQRIISNGELGFVQEKMFIDKLMNMADNLTTDLGLQYGLYQVVAELDPNYPEISIKLSDVRKKILARSKTKIFITEFNEVASSNSSIATVGRRIRSDVETNLTNNLGGQVQIVSDVSNLEQQNSLSGISIKIKADILQAAIESFNRQGQKSINVQTGINKVETEAYAKWKKRKRGDMPKQFNDVIVKEDIIIKTEHQKKTAVVEIAYQILDSLTQQTIESNTLSKGAVHQGESTEEFQKGMFHQPYVESGLPTDIQIMDNLAKEISDELGKKLITFFSQPENTFYEKYLASIDSGNTSVSIELLSNAVVLLELKKKHMDEWLLELKKKALIQANIGK